MSLTHRPRVIAFDLFGTLVDMGRVPREEIEDYGAQIRRPWAPLTLPEYWQRLPFFADVPDGILGLRKYALVVTMSNAPLWLQVALARWNEVAFDALIPLELRRVYKPHPDAYLTLLEICDALRAGSRDDVLMVTANQSFGDLEAAVRLGVTPCLIRHRPNPARPLPDGTVWAEDTMALAQQLERLPVRV